MDLLPLADRADARSDGAAAIRLRAIYVGPDFPDAERSHHVEHGAIADLFAPEMVWRIEGRSAASREYGSRQQFVDEVLAPFGGRFAAGERFRPVRIRSIHADCDTVIVIWDGSGVANDGGRYENSYAWVMRMRDGQVIDGTAFYDSIAFNDLWARVSPG